MPKALIVQFTPIRSCLVNLPSKWVNALLDQRKVPQNVMLEITNNNNKKVYCGWSGEASKPLQPNSVFTHGPNGKLDVLEMDPQLGQAIGLQDGQKVNVEFCRNVPECATVHVEPLTEDDWEILELHAGYVEENLLSQTRVVYQHQTMCVWIHGKTLVRLVVAELDPKQEFLKLTNNSEVIVAPKVRKQAAAEEEQRLEAAPKKIVPCVSARVLPSTHDTLDVHVHPDTVDALRDKDGELPRQIRLSKLQPVSLVSRSKNNEDDNQEQQHDEFEKKEDLVSKALYANLVVSKDIPLKHVQLGSVVRSTLELKDFDIVKVSTVTIKKNPTGSLILRRFVVPTTNNTIKLDLESTQQQAQQKIQYEDDAKKAIQEWLSQQNQELVITHGTLLDLTVGDKPTSFVLQLGVKKGFFGNNAQEITGEQFVVCSAKNLSIEFGQDIPKMATTEKEKKREEIVLGGVDKVLEKIERYTLANLGKSDLKGSLSVPGSGGVLVTGAHGSGKTNVVKQILKSVRNSLIYTMEINCSEIADERIPVFKELLQKWFDEAAWHSPCVMFFDDLDRLVPAEVEHADSTRTRHLAELFVSMARIACQRHDIMLIATSQQQQSVHTALITHHIFSELCHLNPPNRDERKLIMHAIMSHGPDVLVKSLPHIDLVSVASEAEGFLAADIKALIERTIHEAAVRSIKSEESDGLRLKQQDFTKAREGFVPSSLRGVKLQSSTVNWSDIGGLNETRKAVLETLEWPTKYAAVFSQCPLRLRSGLLLYGYPGCGKTLLASAVAKECGLNFISVKGPEILNKYIGASEKSVRDLFERAQAAKPCVLFFDEFDSIAPRRGHDSTGVTDRVVNQMLTQMDGAEGLDGVYVLAATSRPDLIDPALLRPGRLDKALLCGLPSFEERLDILQALSQKMTLASDVELADYAEKTEGFSGADLQGFLYNAHLEAIHGSIDIESFKEAQNKNEKKEQKSDFVSGARKVPLTLAEKNQISSRLAMIKKGVKINQNTTDSEEQKTVVQKEAAITKSYLEKSLKSTRPSITVEESVRLGAIYDEFVTGRTGELPSGEGAKGVGKRSTLG